MSGSVIYSDFPSVTDSLSLFCTVSWNWIPNISVHISSAVVPLHSTPHPHRRASWGPRHSSLWQGPPVPGTIVARGDQQSTRNTGRVPFTTLRVATVRMWTLVTGAQRKKVCIQVYLNTGPVSIYYNRPILIIMIIIINVFIGLITLLLQLVKVLLM